MTKGTVKSYAAGFAVSAILTLLAFYLVMGQALSTTAVIVLLVVFATLQLAAQLIFFLHVGKESGPRWNLMALAFAILIVCILVGGTLWIMNNVQHGVMSGSSSVDEMFMGDEVSAQSQSD